MNPCISNIADMVEELKRMSDLRAKASVEAMRKGHNVMASNMLKDAAKLNDAIEVIQACFDQTVPI